MIAENGKKVKIKEIKYGMSVLTNIGNYENIRTHLEVTVELEEGQDLNECINQLSKQVKDWARSEYIGIKQKRNKKA